VLGPDELPDIHDDGAGSGSGGTGTEEGQGGQ